MNVKELFTFQQAPLTIVIILIVISWLSFLSVIIAG